MSNIKFGLFGTTNLSKKAHIASQYIQGSGYTGVTLGELQSYLERQFNIKLNKERMFAISRVLFTKGYVFDDKKKWQETIIFESAKYQPNSN